MAAISLAMLRGTQGVLITDITQGTAAPTAGQDFELRYNTTDQNSNPITMLDLQQFLRSIERVLVESALALPAASNNSTPFVAEPQI